MNDKHTFFDSSDMNIVFRSVPISILSLANSNSVAVNFSPPSTAALMAAIFTKFARSDRKKRKKKKEMRGRFSGRRFSNFSRNKHLLALFSLEKMLLQLNENKFTCSIEPWRTSGNCFNIYIICQRFILKIELQNFLSTPHIGIWNNNLKVGFVRHLSPVPEVLVQKSDQQQSRCIC